jgi:hypothetical protein
MSIPVERRELGDGWVLTCRGEDGSDLTLSDVKVKRENLVCQIMGGDTLFFPMFGEGEGNDVAIWEDFSPAPPTLCEAAMSHEEESILDHIRGLLLQAQSHGCWKSGVGGVGEVRTTCRSPALPGELSHESFRFLRTCNSHRRIGMLRLFSRACLYRQFSIAPSSCGETWKLTTTSCLRSRFATCRFRFSYRKQERNETEATYLQRRRYHRRCLHPR